MLRHRTGTAAAVASRRVKKLQPGPLQWQRDDEDDDDADGDATRIFSYARYPRDRLDS